MPGRRTLSPPSKFRQPKVRLQVGLPGSWASIPLLAALVWSYALPLSGLAKRWANEADYSHGFLVPVFAGYLLWHRRKLLSFPVSSGNAWGLFLLALAAGMRWYSNYFLYPLLDAPSLIPCLAGVALLWGGWPVLRWAWPAITFLMFMIPLPGFLAGLLSHPLQRVATLSSTWLLQLLGLPAVARGNVIWLSTGQIGIVDACGGLRMLMLFLAITVGASFLIQRPLWEKIFIGASALVIGVITNILRITSTAILFEYVDQKLAETLFHDLAGWLMIPAAALFLWSELYLLSKILITPRKAGPLLLPR